MNAATTETEIETAGTEADLLEIPEVDEIRTKIMEEGETTETGNEITRMEEMLDGAVTRERVIEVLDEMVIGMESGIRREVSILLVAGLFKTWI